MRFLILYGTTEGQTGKIARFLQGRLTAGGTDVIVMNAIEAPEDLDLTEFDAVIVAARFTLATTRQP